MGLYKVDYGVCLHGENSNFEGLKPYRQYINWLKEVHKFNRMEKRGVLLQLLGQEDYSSFKEGEQISEMLKSSFQISLKSDHNL